MTVYDVDKLMTEARKLAADFRAATGKPLGISNEIAVHDVIKLMKLKPSPDPQSGYDAIGTGKRNGKLIQIKGRTVVPESSSSQRIGQIKMEQAWDSVMLILMDEQFEPLVIYEAQREAIVLAVKKSNAKRKNRGAMSVSKFMHLSELVWEKG